jgi:transposase-like protein
MKATDGSRNKDYRWRCKGCKQMFTVRTGTIFEESRLPLRVWVYAFWKACSSKKGISALQLSREMEITHKSALFVLRRIRHGLGYDTNHDPKLLTGTVEVDETYVGGRPRYVGSGKIGRGTDKTPVVAMVQRGGHVRFQMMERVTSENLGDAIAANASITARLVTDEYRHYQRIGREFLGGHETVTHSNREYVRQGTDVHTNTVEGVFSLLKRGVNGTFHSISKKHLPNYLNEFEFRYNTRKVDDGTRVTKAIKRVQGKRLTYRESVDNPPYFAAPKQQPDAPFEG